MTIDAVRPLNRRARRAEAAQARRAARRTPPRPWLPPPLTDGELLAFAAAVRDVVLRGRSSEMQCVAVTEPLTACLTAIGVPALKMEGSLTFHGYAFHNHAWVRLPDGRVLDPTADQAADDVPPVYLGPPLLIHKQATEVSAATVTISWSEVA